MTEGRGGMIANARLLLIGLGSFVLAFGLLLLWQIRPLILWLWEVWEAL